MSKFAHLAVGKIKIKNGALTAFYNAPGTSLTVPTVTNNPTKIFVSCITTDEVEVTRTRGNKSIGKIDGVPPDGIVAGMVIDDDPQDGDTYTLSGSNSGSAREMAAVVNLR